MRSLPFHLCLLLWCQAADTFTDQLTDLGQNVTIKCNLDENEDYWILLKQSDPPVLILRSFSSRTPFYFNKIFSHKYLIISKHHLFINNVSVDELGVYCCMSTSGDPVFNCTRLRSIEPTPSTVCQNSTVVQFIQHNHTEVKFIQQNQASWSTLTLISGLLNAVLVVVVIGLLKPCAFRNKRSEELPQQHHRNYQEPTQLIQQPPEPDQLQRVEEDTSMLSTNTHSRPVNSTYTLLNQC